MAPVDIAFRLGVFLETERSRFSCRHQQPQLFGAGRRKQRSIGVVDTL